MKFSDVDRRYAELRRKYETGTLSAEQFDAQLKELMVQDKQGRWWAKGRLTGAWSYYDGKDWIKSNPPYLPPTPQQPDWKKQDLQTNKDYTSDIGRVAVSIVLIIFIIWSYQNGYGAGVGFGTVTLIGVWASREM